MVPIVEPKILIVGVHDIETTAAMQERVVPKCYQKLKECGREEGERGGRAEGAVGEGAGQL